jgi:predicted nucleotidyltransferase
MNSTFIFEAVKKNKEQLTNDYRVSHIYLVGSCIENEIKIKNDVNIIVELSNGISDYLSTHAELLMYLEDLLEYPVQLTVLRSKVTRLTEDALLNKYEIF